jgi:hypothetical protein
MKTFYLGYHKNPQLNFIWIYAAVHVMALTTLSIRNSDPSNQQLLTWSLLYLTFIAHGLSYVALQLPICLLQSNLNFGIPLIKQ